MSTSKIKENIFNTQSIVSPGGEVWNLTVDDNS